LQGLAVGAAWRAKKFDGSQKFLERETDPTTTSTSSDFSFNRLPPFLFILDSLLINSYPYTQSLDYSFKMSASKSGLKAEDRKAIGITLGNSNSSIAHLKEDNVEVMANEDGGML
jgi:hypothetical protein